MRAVSFVAVIVTASVLFTARVSAAFTPTLIARTGNSLPGSGFNLSTTVHINVAGPDTYHIQGTVRNQATGSITWGSALRQSGTLSLLSHDGMPAPGLPGVTMSLVDSRYENGWQSLRGSLVGTGAPGSSALWIGPAGSMERVVTAGTPAPGAPGQSFGSVSLQALAAGRAVVVTTLKDSAGQSTANALYAARGNALQLVATTDASSTGTFQVATPAGVDHVYGSDGRTLYLEEPGTVRRLVGTNAPIPGIAGGTFSNVVDWSVNSQGTIAFSASYTSPAQGNSRGVFVGTPDNVRLVATSGQVIPGTNQTYSLNTTFGEAIRVNAGGTVAMYTGDSIFRSTATGWERLLRRLSTPMPGVDGATFDSVDKLSIDDLGNVYFMASGPQVGDFSIWSILTTGEIVKIVANGDLLDYGNGVQSEVAMLSFFEGNTGSGNMSSVLPNGIAFHVRMANGGAAAYAVQVPEPSCIGATVTVMSFALSRRRRRQVRAGAQVVSARRA